MDFCLISQVEVLSALQRLGETLSTTELQFLEAHASAVMKNFDVVTDEKGQYSVNYCPNRKFENGQIF